MERIFIAIVLFTFSLAAQAQLVNEPLAQAPMATEPTPKCQMASYSVNEPTANVAVLISKGLPKSNGNINANYSIRPFSGSGSTWNLKRLFGRNKGQNGGNGASGSSASVSGSGRRITPSGLQSGTVAFAGYRPHTGNYNQSNGSARNTLLTSNRPNIVSPIVQGRVQLPGGIALYAENNGSGEGSGDKEIGNWGGPGDKNSNLEGEGELGVVENPLGSSLIPLLLMLLCYALFRLVRGDVREEQEMA